ncbi:MAG: phage holin family protein [Bacilli bacterium]|nr:phage holin family protein [Bacilli bacterium]
MNILSAIKVGLTAVITWIGWLVGGYDTMMVTLLLFMCTDYISGILCGISNKELSSEVGFKGIAKKIMILLLVGATNLLGQATGIEGLRYIVISFYLANEGISIIENASILGLPVPQKIKDVLEQLKNTSNEK